MSGNNDSASLSRIWAHSKNSRSAAAAPATPLGTQDLQRMLERLCDAMEISGPERHAVLKYQALTLDGTPVALKMEEWSGFVKIFVDVGLPQAGTERDTYRYLLEQQLYMPAPFSMVPALHPQSGHIVLTACAPLPAADDADTAFLGLLQACVAAARALAVPPALQDAPG